MDIGKRIKELRKANGLSQTELSQKIGKTSPAYIAFLEKNQRNISLKDFLKMCEELNITPQFFFAEEGDLYKKGWQDGWDEVPVINCDADPYIPDGWKVGEHIKGGQLEWSPNKVSLYLSDKQKKGGIAQGHKLREKLKDQHILNACVLDYLLAHPHIIPEEWKDKYVFFWGTIYRNSDGDLCVRCLHWFVGEWGWCYGWLDDDFDDLSPAAVLASN